MFCIDLKERKSILRKNVPMDKLMYYLNRITDIYTKSVIEMDYPDISNAPKGSLKHLRVLVRNDVAALSKKVLSNKLP